MKVLHFINRYLVLLSVMIILSGCDHLLLKRGKVSQLQKDDAGTRWIDVRSGTCTVRVLSFNKNHLRLAIESPQREYICEAGTEPVISIAVPAAQHVLASYGSDTVKQLTIDMSLTQNPTLIKKWALFLKTSSRWQNRPKQKNPWDTSEYKLIKELLEEAHIFASYEPLQKLVPHLKDNTLHIEKVDYINVSTLSYFETELRPMGYTPQERLPIPLVVDLTLK